MKLRADRAALAAAAADAARVLPTRPSAPILNGVLIDADTDGLVSLTAYDFDTSIRASITAEVLDAGRILVPGRRFADFLPALPAGVVELDDSAGRLAIATPRARFSLATLILEDYPSLPPLPPVVGTVDAADLTHGIAKVAGSARASDGVWWSQHIALQATSAELALYATDRYTIGLTAIGWTAGGPEDTAEVAIPARTLVDALRNMTGPVTVHIDDGGFALASTTRTVVSRRNGETYPPARVVIDRRGPETTRISVRADEFADAMARAAKGVGADRTPVRLDVGPDGVRYTVTADDGGADGDVDLSTFDGDPIVVSVNPQLMGDALKPFGDAVVGIVLGPGTRALIVRDPDAPADVQVVQPVRTP